MNNRNSPVYSAKRGFLLYNGIIDRYIDVIMMFMDLLQFRQID